MLGLIMLLSHCFPMLSSPPLEALIGRAFLFPFRRLCRLLLVILSHLVTTTKRFTFSAASILRHRSK
jgi:hypothetical protein